MKLHTLPVLFALTLLFPPPAATEEGKVVGVELFHPAEGTLLEDRYVVVEGTVQDPEAYYLEITVNKEDVYRTVVRDFIFSEEVYLDPGVNSIRVGDAYVRVFRAAEGETPPADYKKVYGHMGLDDSCAECHEIDDRGGLSFEGEPEETCGWCHGDLHRDRGGDEYASVHRPVKEGRCLLCHRPHLSEKPGLPAENVPGCEECHQETFERLEKDRYVHGPLNLGDCRLCHTMHSSIEDALLTMSPTVLCTQCHSEVAPREDTPEDLMPHPMIPEGKCGRCHFPHSSENPRMMRQPSSRICYDCHPEKTKSFHEKKGFSIYVCQKCHDLHRPTLPHLITDTSRSLCMQCHEFKEDAAFTHEFITGGGCFICHTFHEASLSEDIAAICLRCHGGNPRLGEVHQGVDIESSKCTICHLPHQSDREKLLYKVEHTPFQERDCAACHEDLADLLKEPGSMICLSCHEEKDVSSAAAGMEIHPPVEEEDCTFCHSTHASSEEALLKERELTLCLGCHRTFKKATIMKPKSSHEAVLTGECHRCHDPHLSANRSLLRNSPGELCAGCHRDLLEGPGGEAWAVPHPPVDEGKCRLCHRPHTSRKPSLLKSAMPKVCRPCHQDFFKKLQKAPEGMRHRPVREGRCAACHDIHGGPEAVLLKSAGAGLCTSCHASPKGAHHLFPREEIEERTGVHIPGENFCILCHLPHASSGGRLLKKNSDQVCRGCHKM